MKALYICQDIYWGCDAESFGGEYPAAGVEGEVYDLLNCFCQNHIQVLAGFLFLLFVIPFVFLGSLFCFCNHGDGYFVILTNFFGILTHLA